MSRGSASRIVLLFVIFFVMSRHSAHAVDPEAVAEIDYDVLRGKAIASLSSIQSVWIRYSETIRNARWQPAPKGPKWFICAMSGERMLHVMEPWEYPDGRIGRDWRSLDGRQGYDVNYWAHNSEVVQCVRRSRGSLRSLQLDYDLSPLRALGLVLEGTDATLLSLLKGSDSRPVRPVRFRPTPDAPLIDTWEVDLGPVPNGSKPVNRVRVWFDPQFDFLPRQWVMEPLTREANPTAIADHTIGERASITRISRFERVADHRTGGQRWFPMAFGLRGDEFQVAEVRLNAPLSDADFRPPMPPGTEVITEDMTSIPGTKMRVPKKYYVGGQEGAALYLAHQQQAALHDQATLQPREPKPARSAEVFAEPALAIPPRFPWTLTLLSCAAGLMLAAWGLVHLKGRVEGH